MSDYKLIKYGKDAREALKNGADKLAKPVIATLGPLSRNVALNLPYPAPVILHDGVSIAREIRLQDPFEDMGAVLLKEAAIKTNDLAGDGTTTATLLANTLIQEGFKLVEGGIVEGVITGKVNPMVMRKELLKYANQIIEALSKKAKRLESKEEYKQVANISSGSSEIATLVSDAIETVGVDGLVMVEQGTGFESSLEVKTGMEFDNGYLSSYFVTDPDRMICEYEDVYVLITDYTIADGMQLVSIIEKVIKDNNKPLLIIAEDVVGPALKALALTKLRSGAKLVAVMAPEYGDQRKEALEDLAVLTGAVFISRELDKKLEDVEIKDLGRASSIRVTQTHTAITPKNPDTDEIKERANAIASQIKEEKNEFKKEKLEARMAKLSSSVAIINVGGGSDTEIKDKKERVIDAVYATKAAISEGIVAGGGVALRDIANDLFEKETENKQIEELVLNTLLAPEKTILENAGLAYVVDLKENYGINVINGESGDMFEMGVIDAVKVIKLAVRHAFSVAANILTTEYLVSDDIEADRNIQKVKPI